MTTVKLLERTRQKARMIHALTGKHIYEIVDELVSNELERLQNASQGKKHEGGDTWLSANTADWKC